MNTRIRGKEETVRADPVAVMLLLLALVFLPVAVTNPGFNGGSLWVTLLVVLAVLLQIVRVRS